MEASWEWFDRRYRLWIRQRCRANLFRTRLPVQDDDLEELVQEVFCHLLEEDRRRLRCFRGQGEGAWRQYLERIVRTVVLSWARSTAALKRGGPGLTPHRGRQRRLRTGRGQKHWLVAGDPSPERRAVERQQWRVMIRTCRDVAGAHRPRRNFAILRLALIEGWSSREISEVVDLGPSAVDSVVSRARRKLCDLGVELPRRDRARSPRPRSPERSVERRGSSAIIAPCFPC